jgi:hypothetical protein
MHCSYKVQLFLSYLHKNINFNIQLLSKFVFDIVLQNWSYCELLVPLKIYQHTKCHGCVLTGASFSSTSEV